MCSKFTEEKNMHHHQYTDVLLYNQSLFTQMFYILVSTDLWDDPTEVDFI